LRKYLQNVRTNLSLSQTEVAHALQISVRMYQYIESGHRNPSWKVQKRLEQFFGIPASELLAETENIYERR